MSALRKRLVTSFEDNASLSSDNSFLKETDRNSNIDEEVRREIERKYRRSAVNSSYHFPRAKSKPKGSLSFSVKREGKSTSRIYRNMLRPRLHHLRTTSEMSHYSPYMARTPDLRPVKDRPVLRPVMRATTKTKSNTPSPGRTMRVLRFQQVRR